MDTRVIPVIASKKRKKKRRPRPDALPNLPEVPVGNNTTTPTNSQPNDNPNSSVLKIPQLTITPPEDDGNREIYTPPEVNILSQSSTKRKKKKKKQPVLPVVKDEVRPSVVLGYTPRSLCKSVIVQPTVSELEEVCEEAEEEDENESAGSESAPKSIGLNSVNPSVLELAEETSEFLEEVSLNGSETAESGQSSCVSHIIGSANDASKNINQFEEQVIANGSQNTCVSEPTNYSSQETSLDNSTNSCSVPDNSSNDCTFNRSDYLPKYLLLTEEPVLVNGLSDKSCTINTEEPHHPLDTSKTTFDLEVGEERKHNSTGISFDNSADNSQNVSSLESSLTPSVFLKDADVICATVENQFFDTQSVNSNTPLSVVNHSESGCILPVTASTNNPNSGGTKTGIDCCTRLVETMPEIKSDVGQKTKAQLKAERKLAFEAQCTEVSNSSSAAGEAKRVENKAVATQKTKQQQKAEKKAANAGQKEPQASTELASPAVGVPAAEVKGELVQKTKEQLKAERKAAFEAQKGAQIAAQKSQNAQKSKADLRAERRAIQEAQRATKDTANTTATNSSAPKVSEPGEGQKKGPVQLIPIAELPVKKQSVKVPEVKEVSSQKTHLFSHLPQFQWDSSITSNLGLSGKVVHPAIIRAGLKMAQGLVSGSDARCVTTLAAFREVIQDYNTPPHKELSRDLDSKVKVYTDFLKKCRPLSVSMINAIKELRRNITQIPSSMKDREAKDQLLNDIENFIQCHIVLSKEAIADFASQKIHDNDVILIYGSSPVVKQVLLKAQKQNKKFKVIVVDARPGLEGREMVQYLVGKKISCSYVLINAVSYVMKEVSLVLLDCHSLQANGYVMSRVGSSQIALVAQASNVPVLVCCETYKFWDRVHTDAFVDNELGNPEDLVSQSPKHMPHLENWKDIPHLNLVNMTYDVTPADLVTAVVTEIGTLPCTSVLAVLRVKHHDPKSEKKKE